MLRMQLLEYQNVAAASSVRSVLCSAQHINTANSGQVRPARDISRDQVLKPRHAMMRMPNHLNHLTVPFSSESEAECCTQLQAEVSQLAPQESGVPRC